MRDLTKQPKLVQEIINNAERIASEATKAAQALEKEKEELIASLDTLRLAYGKVNKIAPDTLMAVYNTGEDVTLYRITGNDLAPVLVFNSGDVIVTGTPTEESK